MSRTNRSHGVFSGTFVPPSHAAEAVEEGKRVDRGRDVPSVPEVLADRGAGQNLNFAVASDHISDLLGQLKIGQRPQFRETASLAAGMYLVATTASTPTRPTARERSRWLSPNEGVASTQRRPFVEPISIVDGARAA
jgi:hypothetical protein